MLQRYGLVVTLLIATIAVTSWALLELTDSCVGGANTWHFQALIEGKLGDVRQCKE